MQLVVNYYLLLVPLCSLNKRRDLNSGSINPHMETTKKGISPIIRCSLVRKLNLSPADDGDGRGGLVAKDG
jgi:hypothetical protein